jgi:hypothetical protein
MLAAAANTRTLDPTREGWLSDRRACVGSRSILMDLTEESPDVGDRRICSLIACYPSDRPTAVG